MHASPYVATFGEDPTNQNGRFPFLSSIIDTRTGKTVAGGYHATKEDSESAASATIAALLCEKEEEDVNTQTNEINK